MLKSGKLANVISEMKRGKINILGLSEVRWKNEDDFISDDAVAKCVLSTEAHGDRILLVKIQARPTNIVVIQVYMPTSGHDDSEVELMYEKLEEMIKKQKGTDYLVVMGDWNAVVGEGTQMNVLAGMV